MQKIKLAHLFGIPIYVDLTLGLLVGYILLFFGGTLEFRLLMAAMLPFSILFHELAHSFLAKCFGGRVLGITLHLLGGSAMMYELPRKPWQECLVALIGPISSAILGGIFLGALYVLFWINPEATPFTLLLVDLFGSLCFLNFGLAVFNMIPAFPMDGGRILRSALQWFKLSRLKATTIAVVVGRVVAVFWITLWFADFFFGVHVDVFQWDCPEWLMFIFGILFSSEGLLLPLIAYMIWVSGMQELEYMRQEAYYYGDR